MGNNVFIFYRTAISPYHLIAQTSGGFPPWSRDKQQAERCLLQRKEAYNNSPSVFISRNVYFQWFGVRLVPVLRRSTSK